MYTVIQAVHSLLYIVSKVSFLQCCHMKRYNKIFTKNVRGVLTSVRYYIYIYIYIYIYLTRIKCTMG